MNRPSSFDDRLAAWLEEGPSSGPDDLLTRAHARARSTRQRPAWWLALKGETMETTLRARPVLPARLAFILIIGLLVVALAATVLVVGSRLISTRNDGRNFIPQGADALLAFTSWSSDETAGDLYVVRADGMDGRRITSGDLDDWSPAWSPDGSEIAFYSGASNSIQLRVASADGIRVLDDSPGCFNSTQAPAWSPDGRFLLYAVDRLPDDGICDLVFTDVFIVPADGTAPGRRLLASDQQEFTSLPDWSGDRIVMAGNASGSGSLLVADVTDAEQPWDLTARRIESADPDPLSYGWSRWSPDGSQLATTYLAKGTGYGHAVVYPADGGQVRALWGDPTVDNILPDWSPDGWRLSLLVETRLATDYAVYELVVTDSDGSNKRFIDTPELSGNGGPAMFSPDGTRIAARAVEDSAIPADVVVVGTDADQSTVRLAAGQWSSLSWQPVVNPDNPAADAPKGLPSL